MGKVRRLTEVEWSKVFHLRCQSKRGKGLTDDEQALLAAAFQSDEQRYAALDADVFDATVPFGSAAKAKR